MATKKWLGLAAITAAIGSAVAFVFGKKRKSSDEASTADEVAEQTNQPVSDPGEEE